MSRQKRACLWMFVLGLAMCGVGCVPFAWVTPPLQVGGSVGSRTDTKIQRASGAVTPPAREDVAGTMFISAQPLQAFRSLHLRMFDVGVGYAWMGTADEWLHGPQLELAFMPLRWATFNRHKKRTGYFRLGVRSHSRLWIQPTVGFSQAFQLALEWSSFVKAGPIRESSSSRDGFVIASGAHSDGEAGFGFFLEASYNHLSSRYLFPATTGLNGARFWMFSVGMIFRLPASVGAGVAFVPFWQALR